MWATLMLKFIKLKFVMQSKAREEVFFKWNQVRGSFIQFPMFTKFLKINQSKFK